ncbi:hypothetical protein phiOC_p414 [Ochrobactrum phage vB_OspM_OC]|nr:hypothetical protein phiOC_p414 [Ochrobactrum phage vB_OspM_OC]
MYLFTKEENEYLIVEEKTGSIIQRGTTYEEIHKLYRKLKGGCGFIGFTPNFFINNEEDRNKYLDD